ncbi:hypothetical protein OSTOST_11652, partial [Ostertagia ostertagi]
GSSTHFLRTAKIGIDLGCSRYYSRGSFLLLQLGIVSSHYVRFAGFPWHCMRHTRTEHQKEARS